MSAYDTIPTPALLDLAERLVGKLRERLVEIPADPGHHSEMFEADAEELRDLAAYISEQAPDICLDRMRHDQSPTPVCDYFEGRSIDLPGDPEPINLFRRQAG